MRTTLLFLALLASPVLAGQAVWKWVDADGVTHYSDRPVPGATRMEVSTGSSVGNPSESYGTTTTTDSSPANTARYANFEIWKPSDQETIANSGGQVTINIRLDPSLQPGHMVFLYLDGRPVDGFPEGTLSFDLPTVPRGTHTAVAAIVDAAGTRLQETSPVTFFVRQESVAQPPTGPALRPPPKPQPKAGNKMQTAQPTYAALNSVRSAPIDPATNRPVATKPNTATPVTPAPRNGK